MPVLTDDQWTLECTDIFARMIENKPIIRILESTL